MSRYNQPIQEDCNIKILVKSLLVCLIDCDCGFSECWNNMSLEDKKEIMSQLEDVAYDWLCSIKKHPWTIR